MTITLHKVNFIKQMKGKNKMKKIKLKEVSRQFVIDVFDDNLSLSYFKQSNQTIY